MPKKKLYKELTKLIPEFENASKDNVDSLLLKLNIVYFKNEVIYNEGEPVFFPERLEKLREKYKDQKCSSPYELDPISMDGKDIIFLIALSFSDARWDDCTTFKKLIENGTVLKWLRRLKTIDDMVWFNDMWVPKELRDATLELRKKHTAEMKGLARETTEEEYDEYDKDMREWAKNNYKLVVGDYKLEMRNIDKRLKAGKTLEEIDSELGYHDVESAYKHALETLCFEGWSEQEVADYLGYSLRDIYK